MTAITRRRALAIFGAAAGVAAIPALTGRAARAAQLHEWQGIALGAPARISLAHPDGKEAQRLFALCAAEIERLEGEFSLHRDDSALSILNRRGALDKPSADMVRLLSETARFAALTDGAFDVTVQPLWRLYAGHFSAHPGDQAGPAQAEIDAARALVDYRQMTIAADRVGFATPGMAVTLNGIAQGYVTDRIADILRANGIVNVLVDLGETMGVGEHPEARPWAIGLTDPFNPATYDTVIELSNRAVATSGGYGTRFSADGRHHHLFDPRLGASANAHASASVLAPNATTADALSTALFVAPTETAERVVAEMPEVEVYLTATDGTKRHIVG
ncbi:MAG: FAD:protein FMN transferase [Alphaproteobacteria bacterium]